MLQGLRAADAQIFQQACGTDLKLLARCGSLLAGKLSCTETALGVLVSTAGSGLLMDQRLKTVDEAGFAELAALHRQSDLVLIRADDGWRVIALADELDNPLLAALAPAPAAVMTPEEARLPLVVAGLAPGLKDPVEHLLAAQADDQRAAALERLRYAAPPLGVVGELMPLLLADGADLVRERAIALLSSAGAHVAVVDVVRALQRGDDTTLDRLADPISHLPAQQQDVVVSALVASAARGHTSPGAVAVARAVAPHLATHRALDRLLELYLPRQLSLIELVRALQQVDRDRVDTALARNLGLDDEQDAQLIILLAAPTAPGLTHPVALDRLISRGVELLVSAGSAPRERMALAAAVRRLEHAISVPTTGHLLAQQAQPGKAFLKAHDTSFLWLLAELCRDGRIEPVDATILAQAVTDLLREGRGPHIVAALEQQLPALLPVTSHERLAMIGPMLGTVARFHDDRSRDVVIACGVAIGIDALPALWDHLEDHPRAEVRLLCAELVPQVLCRGTPEQIATAVARLLQGAATTEESQERAARLTAAALLAVQPGADPAGDLQQAVEQATMGLGDWAVEALGHLAAGPHADQAKRSDLITRLLRVVEEDLDQGEESPPITDPTTAEVTWVVEDHLARHTDLVPRALRALEHIAASGRMDPVELRSLVGRLVGQWKQVASWKVVWGPGNIRELGEVLGRLAERADFPPALRVQVVESLLPSASQLAIARVLARVFTMAAAGSVADGVSGGGSYLATLAGRFATRLVQLAAEDHFVEDERNDLLEVLVDIIGITALGREGPGIRRKLVHLIGARHDQLTSRARAKLRFVCQELEPELRERLVWV